MSVTDHEARTSADIAAVVAARAGDRRALDALVAEYLPLVYSIVGRAVSVDVDVDDVVQETMIRVVRGIGGLRDPESFRSWLVAIAVNQIRKHRRRPQLAVVSLEEQGDRSDPGAEFVDHTLIRLNVVRQRQEIERSALWLTGGDRDLLSLWLLEGSGHLTRTDIADALRLDPHTLTVRVSRMKGRLEGARMLVRALPAKPLCPQLAKTTTGWSGEPSSLWRKRFLRHVGACRRCRAPSADLLPAERLLLGLALLPLPAGCTVHLLTTMHTAAQTGGAAKPIGPRIVEFVAAKPALTVAGVAAACAVGLTAVVVPRMAPDTTPVAQSQVAVPDRPMTASSVPPTTAPAAPEPLAAESTSGRLLTLLNDRRRALGLPAVDENRELVETARSCAEQNVRQGGLTHCGHEVLFRSSGTGTPPEQIMEAWFASPGHKQALTYDSSRHAGAAVIVIDGALVAALSIDY